MQENVFQPRPDPRPKIEAALHKAIELSSGEKQYNVTNGTLVLEDHNRYHYTFTLESSWDLADGTDLQLTSSDFDHPLPVQLLSSKEESVTVLVGQRLPARTLSDAFLKVDRAFLLRKLKEALDPLMVSPPPAQLGLTLFGHLECADMLASARQVDDFRDIFPADDAQRLAIQRALASELLMILGPPGTGKTDVLAAIAFLHATTYRHRVLVCSHTNIAVDNAILRLVKFFKQRSLDHRIEEEQIVRYGEPHLAELETDAYRHVSMPLIVADAVQSTRDQITEHIAYREQLRAELRQAREDLPKERQAWETRKRDIAAERARAVKAVKTIETQENTALAPITALLKKLKDREHATNKRMAQMLKAWNTQMDKLKPLQQQHTQAVEVYQATNARLKRLQSLNRVVRFFTQLVEDEWERDVAATLEQQAEAVNARAKEIITLQEQMNEIKRNYDAAASERDAVVLDQEKQEKQREQVETRSREKRAPGEQTIAALDDELQAGNSKIARLEHIRKQRPDDIRAVEDRLARFERDLADVRREATRRIVEGAQIIGATLTSLYLAPTLLQQEWDVVIIDEGSMAPPPAVLVAANRAKSHLIVVGDPLQLAPVCKFRDPLVKHWLGRDVFHHGGYTLEQAAAGTHHSVLLPYQSRMATDICDLIREPVYKGRLKDRMPQNVRPQLGPEPDSPVMLYDTSRVPQVRAEQPATKSSRFNQYQAELSVQLARQVLATFSEERRGPECVGIVTPYTAHRNVLKDLVRGTDLAVFTRIGTVHAFQGLEFDALILDLVESPGLPIAPFLKGEWGSEAMRLINVAVTRARHKLLIVANLDYLRTEPQSSIVRQVVERAAQKHCIGAQSVR